MSSSNSFSFFSVDSFLDLLAIIDLSFDTFGILFYQVILIPNHFRLNISLFGINRLLILSFYSLFSLFLMNFNVVFNSLHYDLFIEVLLSFPQRFVRVMLKLYSLSNTIQVKSLQTFFKTFNLLFSQRLIKFVLFLLQKSLQIIVFFDSGLFYLFCLQPHIINLSFVFFNKLVVCPQLANFKSSILVNQSSVFL